MIGNVWNGINNQKALVGAIFEYGSLHCQTSLTCMSSNEK